MLAGMTDPVTLAVLDARLSAITAEMGEALLRTAYSQILNSSRDFSIALTDGDANLIAQADHIPVHVGAMPFAARAVLDAFGAAIAPGDCFLLNDPWHGGSHLPDLTVVLPVFEGGHLLFLCVVRAHQSDIGGATHGAYNPAATEIWQEGIRIPPIRLGEGGAIREDLLAMLAANTRIPRDFRGDLLAAIGAARLGARRLAALVEAYGRATLVDAVAMLLAQSEVHARRILSTWQDGEWTGEAVLDDDGHGATDVTVRARVAKRGDSLVVDLSESDPQTRGFVNSPWPNTVSAVCMAYAYLLNPDVAKNGGAFRPLTVIAREGTVVRAAEGAAVTLCTSHCSNEIVEAVIRALANACPDRVMGGWGRRFRIAIAGRDPQRGNRRFVWHLFHARPGGGGSAAGDGWSSIGEWHSAGGLKFGSVEMVEARFPLFVAAHELAPGTAGRGRHRGGLGGRIEMVLETAEPALGNTAGDGVRHGAAGMLGGEDGRPHDYRVLRTDGSERVLRTKESGVVLNPGDRLVLVAGGGGGWGDPAARDPARDAADRAEGTAA
jgi:N-methylhydantoinase B